MPILITPSITFASANTTPVPASYQLAMVGSGTGHYVWKEEAWEQWNTGQVLFFERFLAETQAEAEARVREAYQRQQEERQRAEDEYNRRQREMLDAQMRAQALLHSLLSARERRILTRYDYIALPSLLHPGYSYRISLHGGPAYIRYKRRTVGTICIEAEGWIPRADRMLLHKLLIEADETRYLETGNLWSNNYGEFVWLT